MSVLIAPLTDTPADDSPHELVGDRWAAAGIWVLILYTGLRNALDAAAKPFWFDELATVAVAGQSNLTSMWRAFDQAQDSSTPLFWLVEHFFGTIIPRQEIAYRMPSILGFGCVLWCLFVFVRRRFGSTVALLAAIVPVLTPLYRPYAVEARGYTAVIACIAIALVCYQRASEAAWALFMGLTLIFACAFHYYGFFGLLPFVLAELTWLVTREQFRWRVWLSIFAGLLPIIAGWEHLLELRRFYGSHFWGQADITGALSAYGSLLRTTFPLAIGTGIALCTLAVWVRRTPQLPEPPDESDHSHEPMLAVGLLTIVLAEFIVAKLAHGTLADRYALATALGLALATAYVTRVFGRRSITLLAVFLFSALFLQEAYYWSFESGPVGRFRSPVPSVDVLVRTAGHNDLPIVVSDGQEYMMLAFYGPPQWSKRFVGLADPAAVSYSGSDSVDRQMLALRCCLALQIYSFHEFAGVHTSFLLYSDGSIFDWWPQGLSQSGYSLRLLVVRGTEKVYLAERTGG